MIIIMIIMLVVTISLLKRKNWECFYIENEILYLPSLFVKEIPLSNIRNIEFETFRSRGSYSGIIRVYQKDAKVVKRYFQTSKLAFFVSKEMVLAEIEKITPLLKKYYIPYIINDRKY
jgi:hypothetical protein